MSTEATKVKLPSIAELTSNSLPKPHVETSPLLHHHLTSSLSTSPRESNTHFQPSLSSSSVPSTYSGISGRLQPPHIPSYQYYSPQPVSASPPTFPQPFFRPVFYPPIEPQSSSRFLPVSNEPVYNAPEVINRPMNECHRCGTTETPEWRRGPNGLRTLCNACGLFHAKLVKRKGAALAAEEVLNNKVFKGKNGRRVCVKGQTSDVKRHQSGPQVTDFPPILSDQLSKDSLHQMPRHVNHPVSALPMVPRLNLSPAAPAPLRNYSQFVSVVQN